METNHKLDESTIDTKF